MRGLLPLAVLLALALATTWYLQRIESRLATNDAETHPRVHAEGWDVDVLVSNALGQPRYRLSSPHAVEATGDGGTELDQPVLTVYEDGRAPADSTADHGWLSADQTKLKLEGNVDLRRTGDNGELYSRLQTPSLLVFPEQNRAQTDAPVVITMPGHRIEGIGLRADMGNERYELLSTVQAQHEAQPR